MNINDRYFYYDKPVPFGHVSIYPIRIYDYIDFYYAVDCLLINKNRIPDVKIIQMSYLDYIYLRILMELRQPEEDSENYNLHIIEKFLTLISLSLKVKEENITFELDENDKAILVLKDYNGKTIKINGKQFDEIKRIICEYNMVDLPDETIDPKLEKALEDARKFKDKNKEKTGSLEDQLICVMISTSLKLEDIENLTIRKFQKILERVDHKLHYQLYKTAEMNGAEFKIKPSHWMSEIRQDKYAGLIVDYDETINKFK
jgi:hypothetical protein